MRVIVLFIICLLGITSCNQVNNDLKPVEPETVPSKVIAQVKQWYPDAQNLVFKPLFEKLVWEAKFDSGTDKFVTLADSTKIWDTYRFNPESLPPKLVELVENSAFKGGTFTANREWIGFVLPDHGNRLIYNFHGTDYVFNWLYVDNRVAGAMFGNVLYWVSFEQINVLPQKIQAYINADPDIKFENVEVKFLLNYEKFYSVGVSFNKPGSIHHGYMVFNENGDLKWLSQPFHEPENGYVPTNFDKMPEAMQQYFDASPELADFETQRIAGFQWMVEYKGEKAYRIIYRHKTRPEECEFLFDKDGKLVFKTYYYTS